MPLTSSSTSIVTATADESSPNCARWRAGTASEVQLNRIFVSGGDGRGVPQAHLSDLRRNKLRQFGFDDHLLLNQDGWWSP